MFPDIFKSSQHGFLAAESNFGCSQTGFNNNYRAVNPNIFLVTWSFPLL